MRGRVGDKWSSRILWMCAIGSGIGLYMGVVESQLQNGKRMAAEGLHSISSNSGNGQQV